jgi:hypothetical protein
MLLSQARFLALEQSPCLSPDALELPQVGADRGGIRKEDGILEVAAAGRHGPVEAAL